MGSNDDTHRNFFGIEKNGRISTLYVYTESTPSHECYRYACFYLSTWKKLCSDPEIQKELDALIATLG